MWRVRFGGRRSKSDMSGVSRCLHFAGVWSASALRHHQQYPLHFSRSCCSRASRRERPASFITSAIPLSISSSPPRLLPAVTPPTGLWLRLWDRLRPPCSGPGTGEGLRLALRLELRRPARSASALSCMNGGHRAAVRAASLKACRRLRRRPRSRGNVGATTCSLSGHLPPEGSPCASETAQLAVYRPRARGHPLCV